LWISELGRLNYELVDHFNDESFDGLVRLTRLVAAVAGVAEPGQEPLEIVHEANKNVPMVCQQCASLRG